MLPAQNDIQTNVGFAKIHRAKIDWSEFGSSDGQQVQIDIDAALKSK